MRLDQPARLERLLARHDGIVSGEFLPGSPVLFRRDELLVATVDAEHVSDQARRWVDRTTATDPDATGVAQLRLRRSAKVDVCALAEELSSGSGAVTASPNHILRGEPHYGGGPFDDPTPAPAMAGPEAKVEARRAMRVAILDTGIANHEWWDKTAWYQDCGEDVTDVVDADLDFRLDSEAGHGTFVAGIVLQHAPTAHLCIERVLSSDGVSDELTLVRALHRLRDRSEHKGERLDVLNLSLGGYTYNDKPNPLLTKAINRFDRRTVIVACAGNAGTDRPFWPAAIKRSIAVGALNTSGACRAPFSNFGWWVDACAVGEDVHSTFIHFDGPAKPIGDYDPDLFEGYARWSGTSFAAPVVTGMIAATAAAEDVDALTAAHRVLDSATHSIPDLGVAIGAP
ncbi:MAG: S8/S53 family peptidase [Sporichthyaceae bacterium]|nr:S8/S53 family peptidase [Sporichthyaceae bacterium]